MATFKCHHCGTELMKSALVCRSCDAKTKRPSTAFEKFMLVGALSVFIVSLVLLVVAHMNKDIDQAKLIAPTTVKSGKIKTE